MIQFTDVLLLEKTMKEMLYKDFEESQKYTDQYSNEAILTDFDKQVINTLQKIIKQLNRQEKT